MKKILTLFTLGFIFLFSLSSCDDDNSYPYLEEQYSFMIYEFENGIVTPLEGTPDGLVKQYTDLLNDKYVNVYFNTYRIMGSTVSYNFTRYNGYAVDDNFELDYRSWKEGERNIVLNYYENESNTPYGFMRCRYLGKDNEGNLKYEADITHYVYEYKKTIEYYMTASFTLSTNGEVFVADIHHPPFQL